MDAATIIQRIRALAGTSQKELANLANVAPSTISRIERGTLDPTWGMLSKILEATGNRINGDTVVSAGDSTAITAARSILESFVEPDRDFFPNASSAPFILAGDTSNLTSRNVVPTGAEGTATALYDRLYSPLTPITADVRSWLERWTRAGWLSAQADPESVVTLAVSAGNAAKLARRNVARRIVAADEGWQPLARRLGEANIDYAVSGLLAVREDRSTATSANPVIYVESPSQAVRELNLEETVPGNGVLLIAPAGDELLGVEVEDGIRFVARTQGVLDALAGMGREPDKAEMMLRHLLEVKAARAT